jgi:hypothetical protein
MNIAVLDYEEVKELSALVASILAAAGYGAKVWAKGKERVYVTRTLSRREQAMGYVEVMGATGERNYNGLDRATAIIRDLVEGDPCVDAFVAAVAKKNERAGY